MKPKFEEKTFESYFNTELDQRASIYFPFGQVQEGSIGADASAMSKNRKLWWRLGHPFLFYLPFRGVSLREMADEMEHVLGVDIDHIPDMKANLLFQYKRPERITSRLGNEWPHWNEPYFRYDIYKEQQSLLSHLAGLFGSRALILYAAPAINDVNHLVNVKRRKKLIEHTNFRPAADLDNHDRNTYTRAGRYSIACSEPEQFEPFDLLARLAELEHVQRGGNRSFVKKFASEVRAAVSADGTLGRAFRKEMAQYKDISADQYPLFLAMLTMKTFRELSGAQWVVATGEP